MPTLGQFVVVNELGVRLLRPAPRSGIEFVGKDAYSHWDGDALHVEVPSFAPILPIETSAGKRRVRQPCDCDVVENVVAGEAFGFSSEGARDHLVAACVGVEEISRLPGRG